MITSSLWRVLHEDSLWHRVIVDKYLHNSPLISWLRKPRHLLNSASRFWSNLVRTVPIILNWISWIPGAGHDILIGKDKVLGLGERSLLPTDLISHINSRGIFTLAQARTTTNPVTTTTIWMTNNDLDLSGAQAISWTDYTGNLNVVGIVIKPFMEDALMWSGDGKSMELSVKNVYNALCLLNFSR
jgi:hypothetical protein